MDKITSTNAHPIINKIPASLIPQAHSHSWIFNTAGPRKKKTSNIYTHKMLE